MCGWALLVVAESIHSGDTCVNTAAKLMVRIRRGTAQVGRPTGGDDAHRQTPSHAKLRQSGPQRVCPSAAQSLHAHNTGARSIYNTANPCTREQAAAVCARAAHAPVRAVVAAAAAAAAAVVAARRRLRRRPTGVRVVVGVVGAGRRRRRRRSAAARRCARRGQRRRAHHKRGDAGGTRRQLVRPRRLTQRTRLRMAGSAVGGNGNDTAPHSQTSSVFVPTHL